MAKKKKSLREKLPYSDIMIELIEQFAALPGIGEKSAEKLAYHILTLPDADALQLSRAIKNVKENMTVCKICFNLTEKSPCDICKNENRDHSLICVVEQPKDMWAIEKTGKFKGVYHILTGRLAPLEGITVENLTIKQLVIRVQASFKKLEEDNPLYTKEPVSEIIVATNPDFEGDGTMLAVSDALKNFDVKVSKIARGLPIGGSIEMSSPGMLGEAFDNRQNI